MNTVKTSNITHILSVKFITEDAHNNVLGGYEFSENRRSESHTLLRGV
jgi:hypothetical protein